MRHIFTLVLVALTSSHLFAQTVGSVAPIEPRVRATRSVSGTKGSQQNGKFVVEDRRSIFYLPADKQVIVYFEWEGTIGNHSFEGRWKNPEGKVVLTSDFQYAATARHFGGYLSLDLGEKFKPGMWSLEVRADGGIAGTHTFQIVAGEKPSNFVADRQPVALAEIYKKALAASASVDVLNAKGESLRTGSAFFIGRGLAVTAFQIIDGASSLRLVPPDGRRVESTQVVAYNRPQDWAVLRVSGDTPPALGPAMPKSWSVGDRCFTFEVSLAGNRTVVDEFITGEHTFPEFGERLNVSSPTWGSAIGSPVLNEYGDVIGVLGGSTHPGKHWEDTGRGVWSMREGSLVTPIDSVRVPTIDAVVFTLEELQRRGIFTPPLSKEQIVLWGGLGSHFELKKGESPVAREPKTEFSHHDGSGEVAIVWDPRFKVRGIVKFQLYDLYNVVVAESSPEKVNGDGRKYLTSKWGFNVSDLKGSEYRVDALMDGATVWRGFFRVVD